MADANRLTVDCFVLHHAVTPTWENKSKAEIAQWFSDNGFARAYSSNPNNWSGLINPYTGGRSYSQAHIAGQRVDGSTPDATPDERDAGFRWIPLVADIWGQITWHAGNWNMNCRSIGIECLGDYRNYTLRDWDARILGAFWRPQDQNLGGATAIYGHREVSDSSTECPARIMEMRDTVVSYCNNPPAPAPVITTNDVTVVTDVPFETTRIPDPSKLIGEEVIVNDGVLGKRTIVTRVTYTNGVETNRSVVSDKTTIPTNKVIYFGTKEPVVIVPDPELTPETPPIDVPVEPVPVDNTPRTFAEFLKVGLTIILAQKDKIVALIKAIIAKLK